VPVGQVDAFQGEIELRRVGVLDRRIEVGGLIEAIGVVPYS
jgi:hypothetical protein